MTTLADRFEGYWHIDSQTAFNDAINQGVLSTDPEQGNYAGHYMYMHTDTSGDHFKHSLTREYIHPDA